MKLSDAIMLNGITKPQGHGNPSMLSVDAPCVIGGALQAIGKQHLNHSIENFAELKHQWPWTEHWFACPACQGRNVCSTILWHLNDHHRWTRQQIAEWVSTVEPADIPQSGSCEATVVRHCEDSGQLCGKQCAPGHSLCPDHLSEVGQ